MGFIHGRKRPPAIKISKPLRRPLLKGALVLFLASTWIWFCFEARNAGAPKDVWVPPVILALSVLAFTAISVRRDLVSRTITIENGVMIVRQPGVLPKRFEVSASQIAVVAFDHRISAIAPGNGRFPVLRTVEGEAQRRTPGWLLSHEHGSPLPTISHEGEVPNMAIVFRARTKMSAIRHTTLLRGKLLRYPSPKKPAGGFLVKVEDPAAARQLLREFGVPVGTITDNDINAVLPPSAEFARENRRRTMATVGLLVLVLARTALPVGGSPSVGDTGSPRAQACLRTRDYFMTSPGPAWPAYRLRPSAARMRASADPKELERALAESPSRDYELWEQHPTTAGDIASRRNNPGAWLKGLTRLGFVDGWLKTWTLKQGATSIQTEVFRFSSEFGAYSIHSMAHALACPAIVDMYQVAGLDGGLGIRFRNEAHWVEQISFVRDNRRYLVAMFGGSREDRPFLESVAKALANR